jgi:nitrogen fixation protein FixH
MSITIRAGLLGAYLALAHHAPALAQHAHSHAAPNGGQIQQIGKDVEGELVVKGSDVILFLVDESEKKIDAAPYAAVATVLAKGNQQKTLELKPAGGNTLAAKIDFPVEGKFRASLTLKKGTAEVGKARFNLDPK